MKLKKVISGMQTGADQTFLVEAQRLGLETGGWAPKGFWTEDGPAPEFAAKYGVKEHASYLYAPRTYQNAAEADFTVWVGATTSPGFYCTRDACQKAGRLFLVNPGPEEFLAACRKFEVMNGAGNRASKNPTVVELVRVVMSWLETANKGA